MAIDDKTRAEILRLYYAEKWKIGTIARQLGVHHSTVDRVLAAAGVPREERRRRRSKFDPFLPFIRQTLPVYPRLTASRLYQMARERGYRGSQSHFRRLVARERPRPVAEAYLRLKTLPGEQAQVDWAHFGTVRIGRAERRLMGFVMVLSYSRRVFLRFYLDAGMSNFLRGHVAAFEAWQRVPRELWYDNLKSVVAERHGDAIRFNPQLLAFAGHYRSTCPARRRRATSRCAITISADTTGWPRTPRRTAKNDRSPHRPRPGARPAWPRRPLGRHRRDRLAARAIAWEEEERRSRSLKLRLGTARIGRFKPLADFDWDWPRRRDRMAVEDLMSLDFLNEAANVVLVGPNGVGKSTIAANIAHRAVLAGHTVRFATAASLLGELATIDSDSLLQRKLRFYARQQLLVIDEVGYLSYSNRHADLLFNIVSSRSRSHSTIITTNRPFAEWGEAFPNAACLVALVDRLVHNAEIVAIDGDSYRRKEAEQRQKERSAERRRRRSRTRPSSSEPAGTPPTG